MLTSLLIVAASFAQLPGETEFLNGDNLQRAGQWEAAVPHFEAAGNADAVLKPYAQLRIAQSEARLNKAPGGNTRLQSVIADYPKGPWTAIAQSRLAASLAAQQHYAESVALHDQFIKLPVEPWWLDDIAKANADAMLRLPDRRNDGLDYYHDVALNNIYPKERTEAARKLLGSGRPTDFGAAALGFFRSASPSDAVGVLTGVTAMQRFTGADKAALKNYAHLGQPDAGLSGNPFDEAAKKNPDDLWVRAWLIYAVRAHGEAKRFKQAQMAAFAIADNWPTERDTGDTLNWLAGKVESGINFEAAIPIFYKMAQSCPAHHHADDGMLRVGDYYATRGNTAEAVKAYDMLATLNDAKLQDLGAYKAALLLLQTGDKAGGQAAMEKTAALAPGKFYAHRALDRLGKGLEDNYKVDGANTYLRAASGMRGTPPPLAPVVANAPQFQRLRFFGKYGLEEGEWEALDILEKLQTDPAHEAIYQAVAETGFAHTALQFALAHKWGTKDGQKSVALRRLELPRAYWPEVTLLSKETGVDPYLILAVSKQESTFRATVVSHAGASGVMQLMPKTAAWLQEKDADIPAGTASNLKCPVNSIRLGANYLQQMIARSGGNLAYAVASYNGGPGNVDKWRKLTPTQNLDTWIESIPYAETQDYVRKVLGYYMAYHSLYPAQ